MTKPVNEQSRIHIGGNVSGQVAYGQFVYQVQAPGGTVTQIVVADPIKARPRPVDQRSPPIPPPLGRGDALNRLGGEPAPRASQIHGADGWGKTTMLKHLARLPSLEKNPDGISFISAWGRPIEDIEQEMFDAFFESALPQMGLKATAGQIRASMQQVDAVILIDDVDVDRRHLERLTDAAPRCRFIFTSSRQTLLDGETVGLGGLDPESGLALFSNRLGQRLDTRQSGMVSDYVGLARGQPLAIVWAAAAVKRGVLSMDRLGEGVGTVLEVLGDSLDIAEMRALGALNSVNGAPLPPDAIGLIGAIDRPEAVLDRLRDEGLAVSASPRYRIPTEVASRLRLVDLRREALAGMTIWARRVSDASQVVEASAAILELAAWGKGNAPEATINLVRAAHSGFFLGKEWESAYELISAGAQAANTPFDEAWILHEAGTTQLLLGNREDAWSQLRRALSLRREIGDSEGESVTLHNLHLLEPPPPTPPRGGRDGRLWWLLGVLILVLVGVGGLLASGLLDDGDPTTTVPGTLAAGNLEASIDPLDMGVVTVGSTSEAVWSVVNTGAGPVDIDEVLVDPPFQAFFDCGTIEPAGDCEITVIFTPDAPGDYRSDLTVPHTGEGSPLSATVLGSGIEPPVSFIDASPPTVDFGAIAPGDAVQATVEIRNSGEAFVDFVDVSLDSGELFTFEDDCETLEPGENCFAEVFFADVTNPGIYQDVLVVDHSAENDVITIPMTVTIIAPPDLVGEILEWGPSEGAFENDFFSYWAVPVLVRVNNVGGETVRGEFRLHFEDLQDELPAYLPAGLDPANVGDMTVDASIEPGDFADLTAFVAFSTDMYDVGQTVPVRLVVDSCLGEEFVEDPPCRVFEGDFEDNNTSELVEITIEDTEQIP